MIKKLLCLLVLLLTATTGAWAQEPTKYKITVAEGTEDAENWDVPKEAAAGTAVTATYKGDRKVKSVKAVKKAAKSAEGHALSASAVGEIVGSDGNVYAVADKDNLPEGVTAVAKVCYVDGNGHGLALALTDEEGTMNWSTAQTTCAAHTPAFTGGTWKLASQDEWKQMFSANGGNENSSSGLNVAITAAGGTALQKDYYWSSTGYDSGRAYYVNLEGGFAGWYDSSKGNEYLVRACLAF